MSILDVLRQAQNAVGLLTPGPDDYFTCDVDDDGDIDVIDAVITARANAALPVTLACQPYPLVLGVTALTGPSAGTNRVPVPGGETIEVTGVGFLPGATVTVLGQPLAANRVDSSTLTFVAPAAAGELAADVTVSNPLGSAHTLVGGLIYTLEYSLAPFTGTFTRAHASHLYRRAAFGGTPAEIDAAVALGLNTTTASLVNFANDPGVEASALTMYAGSPPPAPALSTRVNKEWWIHLMVNNPNPFQERFAWFLHDHFAISERNIAGDARWFMHEYVNLMRRASVGTGDTLAGGEPGLGYDWYRLVVEMSKDRAMLDWLDGRLSVAGNPNENYARELWELFTLGEGNGYTQADIYEAARALTGFFWFYNAGGELEIRYRHSRHDGNSKTLLGMTGFYGYDDVSPFYEIDPGPPGQPELGLTDPNILTDPSDASGGIVALTFQQRPVEVSRFICGKLADFFLYDDPSDAVVDELAADLRTPGPDQWNLRPVILKILRSEAMYSARAMKGKYKNPVDFVIGFLRTTGINLSPTLTTNASRIRSRLEEMEQVVLDPPDVSGWPEDKAFITSQGVLRRLNFLTYSVEQLDTISSVLPLVPAPRASITPTTLVDHIDALLDAGLSQGARTRCIGYVNSQWTGGQPAPLNFDPNYDPYLIMKTRGLLWIIGQYHGAQQK